MAHAINFHHHREQILSGEQDQTIRPKRSDVWLQKSIGDELALWWFQEYTSINEKLKTVEVAEKPFTIEFDQFDDELAQRSGFSDVEGLKEFIEKMYENPEDMKFVVIRWK